MNALGQTEIMNGGGAGLPTDPPSTTTRQESITARRQFGAMIRARNAEAAPLIRQARRLLLAGDLTGFSRLPYIAKQLYQDGDLSRTFNFSMYHQATTKEHAYDAAFDEVKVIPWDRAELTELLERFVPGKRRYCIPDKVGKILAAQKTFLANPIRRGNMSHAWFRLPAVIMNECREQASLKDVVKIVAIGATIATGAVLLGNALAGATVTNAAAAGGASAGSAGAIGGAIAVPAIAPTVTYSIGGAVVAAPSISVVSGVSLAGALGTAEKVINAKRTIDAVKNGEMPPPPISLGDGSFTDFAAKTGEAILQDQLQRKLTEAEKKMMEAEIERQRRYLAQFEPAHAPVVNSRLAPELTAAQKDRADQAIDQKEGAQGILLALAIPAALFLIGG